MLRYLIFNFIAPSGAQLNTRRLMDDMNNVTVAYTPFETGSHRLDICYGQMTVENSPFTIRAFDVNKVLVVNMPKNGRVGQQVTFDIDASQAGVGNMEIMINKGQVQCGVQALGGRQFRATFVPEQARPHQVEIAFNTLPVPGSPWTIQVEDAIPPAQLGGQLPRMAPANQLCAFEVAANHQRELKAVITDPTGFTSRAEIMRTRDGMQKVQFTPTRVGPHVIELTYDGKPVDGSPIHIMVFNPSGVQVGPIPIGVIHEMVEVPVDMKMAGDGELDVQINNGEVRSEIERTSATSYAIKFIPDMGGDHFLDVQFNGHAVPGKT